MKIWESVSFHSEAVYRSTTSGVGGAAQLTFSAWHGFTSWENLPLGQARWTRLIKPTQMPALMWISMQVLTKRHKRALKTGGRLGWRLFNGGLEVAVGGGGGGGGGVQLTRSPLSQRILVWVFFWSFVLFWIQPLEITALHSLLLICFF